MPSTRSGVPCSLIEAAIAEMERPVWSESVPAREHSAAIGEPLGSGAIIQVAPDPVRRWVDRAMTIARAEASAIPFADALAAREHSQHSTRSQSPPGLARVEPSLAQRGQRPSHRAAILPESVGVVKPQRPAGEGLRTPWHGAGCGHTTAAVCGPARSLRVREGERGLIVSGARLSDRGLWAVACSGQPEMRE